LLLTVSSAWRNSNHGHGIWAVQNVLTSWWKVWHWKATCSVLCIALRFVSESRSTIYQNGFSKSRDELHVKFIITRCVPCAIHLHSGIRRMSLVSIIMIGITPSRKRLFSSKPKLLTNFANLSVSILWPDGSSDFTGHFGRKFKLRLFANFFELNVRLNFLCTHKVNNDETCEYVIFGIKCRKRWRRFSMFENYPLRSPMSKQFIITGQSFEHVPLNKNKTIL